MDRKTDGEHIASTLGHADRRTPFRSYCAGIILPGDRKSVEPIAARIEPRRVQGAHQSLHHFVANADWSQEDLLRRVEPLFFPPLRRAAGLAPGLSTTRDSPRRAFIRSASPGNIAVSLARRTIVRSGLAVGRQRARKPADRLSALSSRGLGSRPGSPGKGGSARGGRSGSEVGSRSSFMPSVVAGCRPRVGTEDCAHGANARAPLKAPSSICS